MQRISRVVVMAVGALALAGCAEQQAQEPPAEPAVEEPEAAEPVRDERALALLMDMAQRLEAAQALRVRLEVGYDVIQAWGQKLEFGGTRVMSVHRAGRARAELRGRDGQSGVFVFDGTRLWLHSPADNVYASTPVPVADDLDAALAYTVETLDTPLPLSELFRSDLSAFLQQVLEEALYVGQETLEGVAHHHLAFRGRVADLQLWLPDAADALPTRLVLTYREEPGQPQFWARFADWDLAAELPDTLFAFTPPEGAERVPIATVAPAAEPEPGRAGQ